MSRESYSRGFVNAAAAYGVDATALAKFAEEKNIGYANVKNDKGEFIVPVSPDGTTDYLSPTNKVAVRVGRKNTPYVFPQGVSSVTNGPNATIIRRDVVKSPYGFSREVDKQVPVWSKVEDGRYVMKPEVYRIIKRLAEQQNFRRVRD